MEAFYSQKPFCQGLLIYPIVIQTSLSEVQRCVHGSGSLHQVLSDSTSSKAYLKMANLLPSWNSRSFLFSSRLNNSIMGGDEIICQKDLGYVSAS